MQNQSNNKKLRGLDPNAKLQSLTVRLQALQTLAQELPTRPTHRECGFTHEQTISEPLRLYEVLVKTRTSLQKLTVFATSRLEASKHPDILQIRASLPACTIDVTAI